VNRWASDEAFVNHHKQAHLVKADKLIADEELLAEPEEDKFMEFSGGWMRR
jgi:hypothetical protein